jgi:acyl dehydratase
MSMSTQPSLAIGTYEDAVAMVGSKSEVQRSEGPVNWPMIKYFCSSTEDANPSYWDEEFAREQWGGVIVPPAMLVHWLIPAPWRPGAPAGGWLAPPMLRTMVPLPGDTLINVSAEYEYLMPVRVGDWLTMVEELTGVTPEKRTRLGTGHFVSTTATYRNQRDEVVAREASVLFRFTRRAA